MNISNVGSNAGVLAAMAPRQSAHVKPATSEAKESAAHEAAESKATQMAEGELGRSINTYA